MLYQRMNDISKEHTRMQLDSVHHMDQLKAEIRRLTSRQIVDNDRNERLIEKLERLTQEGHRLANEERILKSLEFDEWTRRFNDVHKAHRQTFNWILDDTADPNIPPTGFKHWLESQSGIYWIAGKAGSGKSTLMKYISDKNTTVMHHLQSWSSPSAEPIVISWFFWAAGSPMQRSKEGLFQSLLFQILRRCPWLIPIVCAKRWEEDSLYGEKTSPWSLDELDEALIILANQNMPGTRFCMFIDGLDEYEGRPNEIISRLQLLAKSQGIKLCLSSRPWTEFRTAFAEGKCDGSLLLERHTKPDIKRFVTDILMKDKTFTEAERRDKRYGSFIHEVIERAKGVFLWVYLVVNELLKGLGQRNKLEDLRDKLDTMPESLEDYFQRIFDRIDKAHQVESAKVFLLTAHAVRPLPVECYRFLEQEHRRPGYALGAAVQPLNPAQLRQLYEDVRNRINFLCKDLLEVNEIRVDGTVGYQVDFLHRTVRDFLMTKDMHQGLVQRATNDNIAPWDPHQALCTVELARAKTLPLQGGVEPRLNILFSLVDSLMFYAHEVEVEMKTSETHLLDQLDAVITRYADVDMAYHWTNARDTPKASCFDEANSNSFLALAVQSRLVLYVKEKLDKSPNLLRNKVGRPLLDYALRPNLVTPIRLPVLIEFIDFDMVRMLLDKGANPNQKVPIYGNVTVWGLFLLSCYEKSNIDDTQAKDTWFKAAEMMVRKGADKKLKLETTVRESITRGEGAELPPMKTAKYRRTVTPWGPVEIDTPVELTALGMMERIFGDGKIAEIDAIVPEGTSWGAWSIWDLFT